MPLKRAHPFEDDSQPSRKQFRSSQPDDSSDTSSSSSPPSAADSSSDDSSSDESSSSTSSSDPSDSEDSSSDESSSSTSSSDPSDSEDDAARPPPGVTLYTTANPPTQDVLRSYFAQRHRMFSRYDDGIWMTDNAWFEVTPEVIGAQIAWHFAETFETFTVLDSFCGVGGNSIQFALQPNCTKVIATDTDPIAIACAKHNAKLYGVADKIEFVVGDYFELAKGRLKEEGVTAVFLSPPWGGPSYRGEKVFDLEEMRPYGVSQIYNTTRELTPNMALYIPRTSDLNQLAKLVPDGETVEAIHYCVTRKSKAITAYFGELAWKEEY